MTETSIAISGKKNSENAVFVGSRFLALGGGSLDKTFSNAKSIHLYTRKRSKKSHIFTEEIWTVIFVLICLIVLDVIQPKLVRVCVLRHWVGYWFCQCWCLFIKTMAVHLFEPLIELLTCLLLATLQEGVSTINFPEVMLTEPTVILRCHIFMELRSRKAGHTIET